jgi:hypothetical protein
MTSAPIVDVDDPNKGQFGGAQRASGAGDCLPRSPAGSGHEGVWYINRAKFERYMAMSNREVSIRHTTEGLHKGEAA